MNIWTNRFFSWIVSFDLKKIQNNLLEGHQANCSSYYYCYEYLPRFVLNQTHGDFNLEYFFIIHQNCIDMFGCIYTKFNLFNIHLTCFLLNQPLTFAGWHVVLAIKSTFLAKASNRPKRYIARVVSDGAANPQPFWWLTAVGCTLQLVSHLFFGCGFAALSLTT